MPRAGKVNEAHFRAPEVFLKQDKTRVIGPVIPQVGSNPCSHIVIGRARSSKLSVPSEDSSTSKALHRRTSTLCFSLPPK